ncbi:MAG: LCP family protein [Candidatus Levybacteria bacterium]|nr:LCP family protein [Candidatus Levybacteria bacterium]
MPKNKAIIAIGVFVAILVLIVIAKTASFYPFLFQLIFDKEVKLKQAEPSKINVLILGIGGGSHDGPNLTDTIILANIDGAKNKVTLTSIPRDLWIPVLEGGNKKINEAYAKGEVKRKGGGIALSEAVVENVTGQPVDYAVRIDFNGFVRAVDIIGGLDIIVDKTLDDYRYPISGKEDDTCGFSEEDIQAFVATESAEQKLAEKFSCRYKHLHFDAGPQHLDGEMALEFVRSRHGVNGEGSDFARSKRQQKVITAFKDKIFSAQTLINPAKILSLYDILKDSIDTNIKQEEFDDFIRLAQKMKDAQITSLVIDTGDEVNDRPGLLDEAPYKEEYNFLSVLIPRVGNGDFSEIHQYIDCRLSGGECPLTTNSKN